MGNRGLMYAAGRQWARMSRSSRFGALAVVFLLVAAVVGYSRFVAAPRVGQDSISKSAGPSQSELWAKAREDEAKALKEKCTTGLTGVLQEAQALAKAGDEHLAAATLNPCIPISNDPALSAMVKKVEAARMVKVTKAAKEEAARKKKAGVSIGMSKEDVLASNWGKPRKVNATTTARGTREQWVYDGGYLYFDGDTLTTIQN